jgi:transposase InsO family protein
VQIVDRFSRLKLSRAYGATGETGLLGLEFLNFVYNRPEDDHPLRYIPTTLKSDNGAFIKKREVRSALEALKINRSLSRPYAKDSQGVIERRFRTLWQQFELPLAMKIKELGGTIHLGDFNDLMHEYCTSQQVLEHPTMKGQRRGDLYRQSILSYPPREIDISLLEVACKVYERKVNQDLIIRFNGDEYEAPAYCVGKFIRIHKNMEGELIGELIEEDRKPFILKPFRYRKLGDFEHRPAATYRQKRTRILKGQESTPPKKNNQPAGNRHFFEPSPDTVETDSPFTREDVSGTKFPSVFAAKAYIGKQLSPAHTYNDFAFVFDELLETTLDRVEIDQVLNEITEPQNTLKINGV